MKGSPENYTKNEEMMEAMKPRSKLDCLAEKVLSASGLLSKSPTNYLDKECQPYLKAIEKALGIEYKIKVQNHQDSSEEKNNTSALLTCTPNTATTLYNGRVNASERKPKLPDYWSPPLIHTEMTDYDPEVPILEDFAPFNDEFYISMGQMIICAFSSISGSTDEVGENGVRNEKYSLYHGVDSVRMAHIISVLLELNVRGSEKNRHVLKSSSTCNDVSGDLGQISFLDLLLYYAEGSTNILMVDSTISENRLTIPLINATFKHFAVLPQLESHVHKLTRLFRSSAPSISTDQNSTSLKMEHMRKADAFQDRLEEELRCHIESMERIAGIMYEKADCSLRKKARLRMGNILYRFVLTDGSGKGSALSGLHMGVENTGAAGIDSILKIILRILRGLNISKRDGLEEATLPEAYRHLLHCVLLPLHKPSGMVLWRDQKPLLSLYHKTLVQCIGTVVSFDKDLIGDVIRYIIHPDVWPLEGTKKNGAKTSASTPKTVILLHELDTLLNLYEFDTGGSAQTHQFSDVIVPLVLRLCTCIASDNSRSSERALEFFKNKTFVIMVKTNFPQVIKPLLRALCRLDDGMEVPWNPTVRKMTLLVLRELGTIDKSIFEQSCIELFAARMGEGAVAQDLPSSSPKSSLIQTYDDSPSADLMSLKKSMAGWRPPPKPFAVSTTMPPPVRRGSQKSASYTQPPLTLTGVAPWAIKRNSLPSNNRSHIKSKIPSVELKGPTPELNPNQDRNASRSQLVPTSNRSDSAASQLSLNDSESISLSRIHAYMEKLRPPESNGEDETGDGISSWAKAQASESPVLLPGLRFHNLVFGHNLGEGAFSTVKYARLITKGKTRSHWPEYAVKVVSTQKIEEQGYEKSINREIAILQMMGHPSISRLISAFRFKNGAFLVLEYCSGGDLHSLLKRNGSIDEESTRFVIGEITGALQYIHDLGFVFGDLKPENILITEVGHVKLADFGGCRPLTDESKSAVYGKGRHALKTLRDGDWRTSSQDGKGVTSDNMLTDENVYDDKDDRIEGTTAYLPPEVVLGGFPSRAADSWALGCVLFQCLAGRPPLLDYDGENLTRQKIVTFDLSSSGVSDSDFFLESSGTFLFSEQSKNLIKRLLSISPNERPSMVLVAGDDFFHGKDLFSLHRKAPHHLDVGKAAPSPQWSRRQLSSIWAPQPQEYTISITGSANSTKLNNCNAPIIDGNERDSYFLSIGNKILTRISETPKDVLPA